MELLPCCGMSLQTGSKLVAFINIVFSVILTAITSITFLQRVSSYLAGEIEINKSLSNNNQIIINKDDFKSSNYYQLFIIALAFFVVVFKVLQLVAGVILLFGAHQRHLIKCKIWFAIQAFILCCALPYLIYVVTVKDGPTYEIFTSAFNVLLSLYSLWVVKLFINEINFGVRASDGNLYEKPTFN